MKRAVGIFMFKLLPKEHGRERGGVAASSGPAAAPVEQCRVWYVMDVALEGRAKQQ